MEYGRVMSGWGRISLLIGTGILLGAGCGGRTGALEGGYGSDGSGAEAGSIATAGSSSVSGRGNRGGVGNVAGSVGFAGSTPVPVGGTGIGFGGAYPGGGYPVGGYGYGGTVVYPGGGYGGTVVYPGGGYGGTFNVGGYGGYYGFGGTSTYPQGGFGAGGQGPQACGQCLLQACSVPLTQCLQDFGCISILSCVQSMGCQAFECYSDQYCRGTIDQWGGPFGQSMNELLQTFTCAVQAGCPCN